MSKITIRPAWTFENDRGERVDPQLFDLLKAIRETGKLTLAAQKVQASYRHAWHQLGQWSAFFGSPLVAMQRGKGTQLTVLGEKLLWAEQRSEASLFPQLENIASQLNLEIGRAARASPSIIRIHASHGYAIEKLPELMSRHGGATIDLQYMGSIAALDSLARSKCELAGFHMPIGEPGLALESYYVKWMVPNQSVVRMVIRRQGLILAKGNPLKIETLGDLTRDSVRFVNRQPGSGTRILLDALLQRNGIDSESIVGYETGEFTHAAVAAFVASGAANVGFGVEPAARQFGLDFIPVASERYMLAARNSTLRHAALQGLVALLQGDEFRQMVERLPGYACDEAGQIQSMKQLLS